MNDTDKPEKPDKDKPDTDKPEKPDKDNPDKDPTAQATSNDVALGKELVPFK